LYANSPSDNAKIKFRFIEAGKFGVRPGISIRAKDDWYELDDRPYKIVEGNYDIATSTIHIDYCGLNAPVAPS
jgi:hypothetical protein